MNSFPAIKVWNKKETSITSKKLIDKSLVDYNNNRPQGVMTIIVSPFLKDDNYSLLLIL